MVKPSFHFLRPDWSLLNGWNALVGVLGLGLILGAGLIAGAPGAGAIAAGGAVSVAFGAVMSFSHWRGAPLTLVAAGMALSAVVGSLAGQALPALVLVSAVWAALTALASAMGLGAWWIAMQWSVALIVAGAYPSGLTGAAERGGLVLLGGAAQTVLSLLIWRIRGPGDPIEPPLRIREAFALLKVGMAGRRHPVLFAFRAVVAVALATLAAHGLGLANGYWAPMTVIVVLKPRWRETWERGVGRILGTASGAILASLAAVVIGANPWPVAFCALLAGGVAIALQRVSYLFFAAALTAYVVYLLALLHTPAAVVAVHRVAATLLGGGVALATDAALTPFNPWREKTPSVSEAPA